MKLIIAGSRSYHGQSVSIIRRAVHAAFRKWNLPPATEITEVVSGGAKGIDYLAEIWAKANKIPVKRFEACWDEEGKSAGPQRNIRMLKYIAKEKPAGVVVIFDGSSRGSAHMIHIAHQNPDILLFVGHPAKESKGVMI